MKILFSIFCIFYFVSSFVPEQEQISSYVQREENVSIENYNILITEYNKIPEVIRNHYENNGWEIVMTTKEVEEKYYEYFKEDITYSICGIFYPSEKTIWLEDSENGAKIILHEMGHYVGSRISETKYDRTDEWISIWEIEAQYVSEYAKTTHLEGFAEMFEYIILYPDQACEEYPNSYNYITNIFKEMEYKEFCINKAAFLPTNAYIHKMIGTKIAT